MSNRVPFSVQSGFFITVLQQAAEKDPSSMALELIDGGSPYSQWVIQPGFKTSRAGERCAHGEQNERGKHHRLP